MPQAAHVLSGCSPGVMRGELCQPLLKRATMSGTERGSRSLEAGTRPLEDSVLAQARYWRETRPESVPWVKENDRWQLRHLC